MPRLSGVYCKSHQRNQRRWYKRVRAGGPKTRFRNKFQVHCFSDYLKWEYSFLPRSFFVHSLESHWFKLLPCHVSVDELTHRQLLSVHFAIAPRRLHITEVFRSKEQNTGQFLLEIQWFFWRQPLIAEKSYEEVKRFRPRGTQEKNANELRIKKLIFILQVLHVQNACWDSWSFCSEGLRTCFCTQSFQSQRGFEHNSFSATPWEYFNFTDWYDLIR